MVSEVDGCRHKADAAPGHGRAEAKLGGQSADKHGRDGAGGPGQTIDDADGRAAYLYGEK